jgi:hypothetical protein
MRPSRLTRRLGAAVAVSLAVTAVAVDATGATPPGRFLRLFDRDGAA